MSIQKHNRDNIHRSDAPLDAALQRELDDALGDMSIEDLLDAEQPPRQPIDKTPIGVRTGTVIAIQGDDIFVDFGSKSQGILPAAQFADEQPVQAALKYHNGAPALFINGEPRPPVMYRASLDPLDGFGRRQIANFRDAGIHLFCPYVTIEKCWPAPDQYDFSTVDEHLRAYLSADPEGLLILLVRLIPPSWWMEAHADEWVAYGTSDQLDSSDESFRVKRASPASQAWLRDTGEAWRRLIQHVESQPWGKRVIGYHACYGIYAEWHYFGSWSDQYPDTGPAMTRTFQKWLREKYISGGP